MDIKFVEIINLCRVIKDLEFVLDHYSYPFDDEVNHNNLELAVYSMNCIIKRYFHEVDYD